MTGPVGGGAGACAAAAARSSGRAPGDLALAPAAALDDDAPLPPAGASAGGESGDLVLCVRQPWSFSLEPQRSRLLAARPPPLPPTPRRPQRRPRARPRPPRPPRSSPSSSASVAAASRPRRARPRTLCSATSSPSAAAASRPRAPGAPARRSSGSPGSAAFGQRLPFESTAAQRPDELLAVLGAGVGGLGLRLRELRARTGCRSSSRSGASARRAFRPSLPIASASWSFGTMTVASASRRRCRPRARAPARAPSRRSAPARCSTG